MVLGVAQMNGPDAGANEPVEMMTAVVTAALSDTGAAMADHVQAVRVVKGIWPYRDPGRLVAERLGTAGARSGLTSIGGNEAIDLLNQTAHEISTGHLDLAVICGAETMRTRRRDRGAGRSSTYLDERADAAPDRSFGSDHEFWDQADHRAGTDHAVNFYAMAASAVRHRMELTPDDYRRRIADLWARAAAIASTNPHAWITVGPSAEEIRTPSPTNRMVASPYTKLLTSNIDVDQAAAIVIGSAETARRLGVTLDRWVFPLAGSGGHDPWTTRARWSLAESPAMRIAGHRAVELAGTSIGDIELLDLYSCFPAAVQVAQHELGLEPGSPFTITGGMTFAGGPFNSYCLHALARSVELLRLKPADRALLSGNGGFFTKHSFAVLSGSPGRGRFSCERPQALIDAQPVRAVRDAPPARGIIDAYTVVHDRDGAPERAIVSVLDSHGARAWTHSTDPAVLVDLLHHDRIGTALPLSPRP